MHGRDPPGKRAGKIAQGTTVTINEETSMRFTAVFAALAFVPLVAGQAAAQDAAAGEKVFAKCKACHVADEDKNKIGPSLKGVIGRTAGTHADFKYSKAMVDAGAGGLVWDDANLTKYLHDPKAMVKGTKMAFVGLKKDDEIANVIAYLKQFSQ
jgi:cytochrome c